MEWHIQVECGRCGRRQAKMVKTKYGQKSAHIGCKECGLGTEIELREHCEKVGDLKVTVWYPFYGS